MKLIQTPPAVQDQDKMITHHHININSPFLFSRCSQITAWKNAIHSGVFYILQLIPTFYGLCLQTQISSEAYVIHFNLQHRLNQALLVISLWESPCQLLLLQKKLVAERKKIFPIIKSIIQVKIYRIKTKLLTICSTP
ncbi:hypothetical protein ACB098_01G276000 [Castanea mollissima]